MFRKIFTSLFVLLGLSSCKTHTPIKDIEKDRNDLVVFATRLAGEEPFLVQRVELFTTDRKQYYKKYEEELYQRWIESEKDISIEIVLIDGMIEVNKLAYVDSAYEADQSLILLDRISNSKLSQSDCFSDLQAAYKESKYNAIGTFMHDDKIGPMPYDCIEKNGFYLVSIDEGSDSYPLILVAKDDRSELEAMAKSLGINMQFFGR